MPSYAESLQLASAALPHHTLAATMHAATIALATWRDCVFFCFWKTLVWLQPAPTQESQCLCSPPQQYLITAVALSIPCHVPPHACQEGSGLAGDRAPSKQRGCDSARCS